MFIVCWSFNLIQSYALFADEDKKDKKSKSIFGGLSLRLSWSFLGCAYSLACVVTFNPFGSVFRNISHAHLRCYFSELLN